MNAGKPAKLSAEDRLDIQELFARYCWALNTGDADGLIACFTEDGALSHPPQGRHQGGAAIRKLLDELWYGRPSWYVGRQHIANHYIITREGEGARVKAYWSILQKDLDSGRTFIAALGTWNNFCVRQDDEWFIKELEVGLWTRKSFPWVGEERAFFRPTGV